MEQTSMTTGKVFARELCDGQEVDSVFVVQECVRRQKRNGEAFLKLQLGDKSGRFECVVWESVEEATSCATAGSAAGPPVAYEKMAAALDELIATVQRHHLRELLLRLLDPSGEVGRRWHQAPAAKHYHQAYRHGLLEHCLTVAQGVG